jgi:hypothetical protein
MRTPATPAAATKTPYEADRSGIVESGGSIARAVELCLVGISALLADFHAVAETALGLKTNSTPLLNNSSSP